MDLNVLEWINNNLHGDSVVTDIFKFITSTGDSGFIWIILSLFLMVFKRTRKCGFIMIVTLAFNYFLVDIVIKNIVIRTRPYYLSSDIMSWLQGTGYELPTSYSFPSGHASSGMATAVAMLLYNKKWGIPSVIYALLVALSRVYLCVHYPTDVICGIMIGILVAIMVRHIFWKISVKLQKKHGLLKVNEMISK